MSEHPLFLFLGKFYPHRMLQTIQKDGKGKIGFANHNFEMSIIQGLASQNVNLSILTVPGVFSWPHNNRCVFTKAEKYQDNFIVTKSAGFCNIVVVNIFSIAFSTLYNLLVLYKESKKNEIHIITNAPNMSILIGLFLSKKLTRKKIDITAIIPDIPSMITVIHRKKQTLKGIIIECFNALSIKLLNKCDNHILLTEAMTDFFEKPIHYLVMEGLIDVEKYVDNKMLSDSEKHIVLYTGSIHRQFGVMNLVEAFEKADLTDDVELWICGSGDAEQDLKKRTEGNKRIKYWGLVDSEKAREMQQQASVLVNPRTSEFAFTKYSFPSKTLEYLATGKPVVMNRLPGVPDEYFNYVITPKDESIEQLTITLKSVLDMTPEERIQRGMAGRDFVLKNKNSIIQMKRVVDFIYQDANQ